jgi:hypothetical protein
MKKPIRHIVALVIAVLTTITLVRDYDPLSVAIGVSLNVGIIYALAAILDAIFSSTRKNSGGSEVNRVTEASAPFVSPRDDGWAIPMKSSGYAKGAGWHSDPSGKFHKRYFDGAQWTDQVRDKSKRASQSHTAEINQTTFADDRVSSPSNKENLSVENNSERNAFTSREITNELHQTSSNSLTDELTKLVTFYEKGLLSKEEFDSAKQRLFLGK